MCNKDCPENIPCCLCRWNRAPYKCKRFKCGDKADFCQHDDMLEFEADNYYSQEPLEPPYDYVEIEEE